MIIASIAMYFGFIDPTYKETQALQEKKNEFDTAVNNATKLNDRLEELVKEDSSFPAGEVDRLKKLLPDYVDNVRLIMEVDRMALKYGMSLREVNVEGLGVAQGSASAMTDSTGTIGAVQKDYDGVVLSFSVLSTYPVFKQFLKEIEENLRIIDVENITFSVPRDSKGQDVYQFGVSLRTYWLK